MRVKHLPLDQNVPGDWSVADALETYLGENGFGREQYDADKVTVNFWGIRFTIPNPPNRKIAIRYHDLHHIMTGYGTDPTGEAEISAWELRRGIGIFGFYVQMIILSGVFVGLFHSPIRTFRAWQAGKSDQKLPAPTLSDYETLMKMSVSELRRTYDVSPKGVAGPRRLHRDAPAASRETQHAIAERTCPGAEDDSRV